MTLLTDFPIPPRVLLAAAGAMTEKLDRVRLRPKEWPEADPVFDLLERVRDYCCFSDEHDPKPEIEALLRSTGRLS